MIPRFGDAGLRERIRVVEHGPSRRAVREPEQRVLVARPVTERGLHLLVITDASVPPRPLPESGSVVIGEGPWFWAAPFEKDNEFGGRGLPPAFTPDMLRARLKGGPAVTPAENTTLVVVVTDAVLTKPQAKRLAMIAHTGMARAIYPVHATTDGDVVFAAATGKKPIDPLFGLTELGMVAANTVARAIARGVHAATALPFLGALPAWGDRFG